MSFRVRPSPRGDRLHASADVTGTSKGSRSGRAVCDRTLILPLSPRGNEGAPQQE
jgi:hypothetical protein